MHAFLNATGIKELQLRRDQGVTIQEALLLAFPDMVESKAAELSKCLRGKGGGGEGSGTQAMKIFAHHSTSVTKMFAMPSLSFLH